MLSPNLLKSQIPCMRRGGGRGVKSELPTFDAESKSAKVPNSLCEKGWGGGGKNNQLLATFSADLL